jgi:acetoacetyl-CoA synthetase
VAVREGDLLFTPSAQRIARAQMTAFFAWLRDRGVAGLDDYNAVWKWSVEELDRFWPALAEWGGITWRRAPGDTLRRGRGAEGAHFFPGAELNYVDQVLRHSSPQPALIATNESGERTELTYSDVLAMAGAAAAGLRRLGVGRGDRVAAVLPNGVEAVVGFLATASLGAVWSSCAPEFGAPSMVDRFQQIDPRVLIVTDSYRYGGREFLLGEKADTLAASLRGLAAVVSVPRGASTGRTGRRAGVEPRHLAWDELVCEQAPLEPVAVGFEDPLWILYSSGTTGLPKPIVHGHGGIVLEHLKALRLHSDIGPGERFFWFSTTGWMMWNFLVGGLLVGSTIVTYDGSPVYPDPMALWRMAAETGVTFFGTSAPFIESCRKAGLSPRRSLDLEQVHSIGSTGSPLPPEGFAWATAEIGDDVLVGSVSGGTDVCTAFLHACPLLPVHAGELQCAALGCAVEAYGPDGRPVVGEVGELVVTEPMPSMPVALFGDADGSRLHASYFDRYPGVWRHGDWVKQTERATFVVYGRSDATLNRGGVRMGTAEFYRVVEAIDGVADSSVIDTSELGREGELILLVVADPAPEGAPGGTRPQGRSGAAGGPGQAGSESSGTDDLPARIRLALRERLSPRHVPDRVMVVPSLPRTLNGKKVEVPLRRILLGADPAAVVSRDSLADPAALDEVIASFTDAGLI